MKRSFCCLLLAGLLALPGMAQQGGFSSSTGGPNDGNSAAETLQRATPAPSFAPFSRVALGGGISMMGINLQAATNVTRHTNLRFSGNVFNYSVDDITSNGFTANGKLDLASMGASFDIYPWADHGFRLSPGVLFYNQNTLTASATVTEGQTFTLNDVDYYSAASDPIRAHAKVGLNATNPAFTMTTGWGNMISRKSGHWSFPFELGAAFVGSPTFDMSLAGTACDVTATVCVNSATNPEIQNNLQAQIAKYRKDVDPLKVYPILSFGVSYSFKIGAR
jgi:hypothetical protein